MTAHIRPSAMVRHLWPVAAVWALVGPVQAADGEGFASRGLVGGSLSAPSIFVPDDSSTVHREEADLARFFGTAMQDWGIGRFSIPVTHEQWRLDAQRSLSVNTLAIQWQHSLNPGSLVSLSARYGDGIASDTERSVISGSAAVLSWSGLFKNESRLTGRVFVGDEETRDRSIGYAARRYIGLGIEGRYSLWRDHAPFAGFAWQRNDYQALDGNSSSWNGALRGGSASHLAAGWAWQIQSNWDLRAEANYRLTDDLPDALDSDRSQFFFSTRYGF